MELPSGAGRRNAAVDAALKRCSTQNQDPPIINSEGQARSIAELRKRTPYERKNSKLTHYRQQGEDRFPPQNL
jgi:hypothetical protein